MNIKELLEQRLALYLKAERDISHGQTVEIEGMRITRADSDTVRKTINNLMREIDLIEQQLHNNKRRRIRTVVPLWVSM